MHYRHCVLIIFCIIAYQISLSAQIKNTYLEKQNLPANLKYVEMQTKAPKNENILIWYRIPKNYDPKKDTNYRVLILFGGRNNSGKDELKKLGWAQWADQNDIFLVSPTFIDDEYWDPKPWSGNALYKGLSKIKQSYNICTTKLLYYGYSAGSQASNLFPAWKPGTCRAWVSHACGIFHTPNRRMHNVPGLVTCGDADKARYIISRNFVEECRKIGVNIIWKSFPNHPHDVPADSIKLAKAFLLYYHELHRSDLTGTYGNNNVKEEKVVFIGDDQEHKFYPDKSPQAKNVFREDRVVLPNRNVAEAWGEEAK